jgi:transposase
MLHWRGDFAKTVHFSQFHGGVDMSGSAPIIIITEKQSAILNEFAVSRSVSVSLAQRSKIVVMAFERVHNDEIAQVVDLHRNHVGVWRHRWKEAFHDLVAVECSEGIPALKQAITKLLSDAPRSGRPPSTTSEQLTQVASLAREKPADSGLPITQWTSGELATELVRRTVFETVSASSVRRWLNRMDLKPHRNKYWLFSPDRSTPEYDAKVRLICNVYAEAIAAYNDYGVHTICMDEQTGIQALERIAPDLQCVEGIVRRLEFEYIRHGTLCLFGNFHVATGEIISPTIRETRTEVDFVDNLKEVIGFDAKARFRIVLDNLNTHCSESCVRYVAEQCGIDASTLGEKGRCGILKDMQSRQEFLSNPLHRIHFYFVPKHSSWMNQVEIWFGIVRRKVTRYGNFTSLGNLNAKLSQFIDYYNDVMAHPFAWTYRGKPLCV